MAFMYLGALFSETQIHTNKYTNKLTSNYINMLGKLKTNAFER